MSIRITLGFAITFLIFAASYSLWSPGSDVNDGLHNRKRNGMWLQHGWLGIDNWFIKNRKVDTMEYFRNPKQMKALASLLREHNISDLFPHLGPTYDNGEISSVEPDQISIFLEAFDSFRIMPWVGGVVGKQAFPSNPKWRKNFTLSIKRLLSSYPRLSGIHVNIEPCRSGNKDFLILLNDIKQSLPEGKILSVAAYPPPTIRHPFKSVHWDKEYYKQVSQRADQLVVMMYDTSIHFEKVYQYIMAEWTREVLDWTEGTDILLGLPAYQDDWAWYHDPDIENLKNALLGVHTGLSKFKVLPENYQGIAIYSEWEMDNEEWSLLRKFF